MQNTKPVDLLKYEPYIRPLHEEPEHWKAILATAGIAVSVAFIILGICTKGPEFSLFAVPLIGSSAYLFHYRDTRYTPQTDCSCSKCLSCVLSEIYETRKQQEGAEEEIRCLKKAQEQLEEILNDPVRPNTWTCTRKECHQYLEDKGVCNLLQNEIIPNFQYCADPDKFIIQYSQNPQEIPKSLNGYCEIMSLVWGYQQSILSRIRSIQKTIHVRPQEACSAIPEDMRGAILAAREIQRQPLFPVSA